MLDLAVNNVCPTFAYCRTVETMGERIKRLRVARNLTQSELAKRCQVTKQAVSHWESGLTANIKLTTFLCLLDTLDTDAEYLVWGPTRSAPNGLRRRDPDKR